MLAKTLMATAIVVNSFCCSTFAQDAQPTGPINFQFRESKWVDVLTWFAKEADRALQVNEAPPGDFTYTDTKDYTPNEAIDLLNGVLLSKGFTLIKRDRLLICVNLAKEIPEDLIPATETDELGQYGAFEMVRVTFDLGPKPADDVKKEIEPLIGQFGTAVSLSKTNKLIVTASASQMRVVASTITAFPVPKSPATPPTKVVVEPILLSYELGPSIDPDSTAKMILKLIPDITVTADTKSQRLNVFAKPNHQASIKKVVDQLREDAGPEKKPFLETYLLSSENIVQMAKQLTAMVPDATITPDENEGRLMVFGTSEQQGTVSKSLSKLNAIQQNTTEEEVLVVTVENAEAAAIAEAINNLFARSKISTSVSGKQIVIRAPQSTQKLIATIIKRLDEAATNEPSIHFQDLTQPLSSEELAAVKLMAPDANITVQDEGKRLMVSAVDDDWSAIEKLILQIEQIRRPIEDRQVQTYEILPNHRSKFVGLYKQLDKQLKDIEIIDQGDSKALTIMATAEEHAAIVRLIDEIQQKFPMAEKKTQFYGTTATEKQRFLKLYKQLRDDLKDVVVINAESDELVVRATEKEHKSISEFLTQLKIRFPEPERKLLSYTVTEQLRNSFNTNRDSLAPTLNQIKVLHSNEKDQLVVLATDKEHADLAELLDALRKTLPEPRQETLRLYAVDPAIRERFVAIQASATSASATSDLKQIRIVEGTQPNELVIWALPEIHAEIIKLIERIRNESPANENQVAVYPIESGDLQSIMSILVELHPNKKIIANDKSQQILVWADDETQRLIKTAIERMDVPESSNKSTKMAYYKMGEIDSRDIQSFLSNMLPNMTIQSERDTNSIIAWGSEKDHEVLKQTIEGLRNEQTKREVSVYPTKNRDPYDLRRLLQQMLPEAKIVEDRESSMIAAWATAEEHAAINKAMQELTKEDSVAGRLVVYPTPTTDADLVINLLREVAPKARFADADRDTKVIAWATDDEHKQIDALVKEVAAGDPTAKDRVTKTYTIQPQMSDRIVSLIEDVAPRAKSFLGENGKSVSIWAVESDQNLIESLLQGISKDTNSEKRLAGYKVPSKLVDDFKDIVDSQVSDVASFYSDQTKQWFAFATDDEHKLIRTIVENWNQTVDGMPLPEIQIYAVTDVDPKTVVDALPEPLIEDVSITINEEREALIVRAVPQKQAELKAAIDEILASLPAAKQRIVVVYPLKNSSPVNAVEVLRPQFPDASFSVDDQTKSMIATAFENEHVQIKSIVSKIDDPAQTLRSTIVYPMPNSDPRAARNALSSLLPNASTYVDSRTDALVATASEDDHVQIQKIVNQMETAKPLVSTVVYPMRNADPSTAQNSLQHLLPKATSYVDLKTKSLVATASKEDHDQITALVEQMDAATSTSSTVVYKITNGDPVAAQQALQSTIPTATFVADQRAMAVLATASVDEHARVKSVIDQLNVSNVGKSTVVYRLKLGDPNAAQTVIRSLVPDAVTAVDGPSGSLVATASSDEHALIKTTIDQMDQATDRTKTLEAYVIKNSDANAAYTTLRQAFEKNPNVNLSLDPKNRSIMATATPIDQRTIATIIARMETGVQADSKRSLKLYPMGEVDSSRILQGFQALLNDSLPKAELSVDEFSNQLYAVATDEQHALLSNSISALTMEKPGFEVFQLRTVDPFVFEQAVDRVFEGSTNAPTVSSDIDTQQLIVRGNQEQIDSIRSLLVKMGETGFLESNNANSRTVRFRSGNIDEAIRQLQQVWPKLRKNRIEVIRTKGVEKIESIRAGEKNLDDDSVDENEDVSETTGCGGEPVDSEIVENPDESDDGTTGKTNDSDRIENNVAPIVIVPGPNSITISSDDKEALSQAFELLDTLAQSSAQGGAGNFAVYPMRNAGALQTAKILKDLFKQMPEAIQGSLGRISLVPDPRLNAIVAHGRPADRNVLGELLEVLDADYVDDSLASTKAQIIAVSNTDASRVLTILRTVYKTQLSSGGDRPEIDIPEGVSSEVASVLQQINAATAGPVLTLEVDRVTNSIVMLAPTQLGEQVIALVKRLDETAEKLDSRTVKLIPLKDTNARRLRESLQELIKP